MLPSPDQARDIILSKLPIVSTEQINLAQAYNRTLARDILAVRDQPPFAASAMDGYCVRSQDTPSTLTLIGQSLAGDGFSGRIDAGQCVRIFTGAPIPDGGDGVVIQEDVIVTSGGVQMPFTPLKQHIRPQGVDFKSGDRMLRKGERLDAVALSLIAATGCNTLLVARKPVVALLASGDEIVQPGTVPGPFDMFDALSSGLGALLREWGAEVITLAPKRDTIEAIQAGYREAFQHADLVVTIGGASVGDRDLMRPALTHFDGQFHVERIAVRPGKPTWFATTLKAPVLGLPGNPASALVCAYLFVRPTLAHMQGGLATPMFRAAKLAKPLPPNGPREHYLRARIDYDEAGQTWITPCENQDSSLMSVFQSANALLQLPAGCNASEIGQTVNYIDLERRL
jgi:molybdopterin molybdotransferase